MIVFYLNRLTSPLCRARILPMGRILTGNPRKLAPICVNARFDRQHIRIESNLHRRSKFTALDGGCQYDKLSVPDFEDVRLIYSNKGWRELLRAFFVFSLASWPLLAKNHLKVLRWCRTLMGRRLFISLMRATIYGQFMAGDRPEEVLQVARENSNARMYAMFAYTASEQHGQSSILEASQSEHDIRDVNYRALQEGLQMAAAAKEFSSCTPQLTFKLTFFMDPELLVNLTRLVRYQVTILEHVLSDTDTPRRAEFSQFLQTVVKKASQSYHGTDMVIPQQQSRLDPESLALSLPFQLELSHSKELLTFVKDIPAGYKPLPNGEEQQLAAKWQDTVKLGQMASDEGLSLMIDAEQSYLQKGIEIIAIDMMRKHNKTRPVVYNTYQCYLKSTYDVVVRDLDLASREGFCLGLKVVRGAYVDEESARAVAMGYESPLNPSYEATAEMYNKVSTTLLEKLGRSGHGCCHVTFATHNLDSVKFIINRINDLHLRLEDKNITFAQLLGMRDYISFPLAYQGFLVAKLLHYGPVEGAVAYLARRLAENKAGLTAVNLERRLAWKEIKRRMFGF